LPNQTEYYKYMLENCANLEISSETKKLLIKLKVM